MKGRTKEQMKERMKGRMKEDEKTDTCHVSVARRECIDDLSSLLHHSWSALVTTPFMVCHVRSVVNVTGGHSSLTVTGGHPSPACNTLYTRMHVHSHTCTTHGASQLTLHYEADAQWRHPLLHNGGALRTFNTPEPSNRHGRQHGKCGGAPTSSPSSAVLVHPLRPEQRLHRVVEVAGEEGAEEGARDDEEDGVVDGAHGVLAHRGASRALEL